MKLIIDVRERKLIEEFETDNYEFEKKQLELGDIAIYDNNNELKILIERKTPSDILNSITDGRYNEQAFRLNALNLHNHNIIYLIEGNINSLHNKCSSTILSAMFSLYYFKGFSIWQTGNMKGTKDIIYKFIEKLKKETRNSYYENDQEKSKEYIECIKTCKKDNITSENIHQIMLSQIPNVSSTIAKTILEKYNSIHNLKAELNKNINCLNDIKIINSTGKERKVSSTAVKNIIKYL